MSETNKTEHDETPDVAVSAALADRTAVIAAAIGPNMLLSLQDAELAGAQGAERIQDWIKWISETVAALPAAVPVDRAGGDRAARWEAAAHAAGREVDRNALAAYMAVADAEQAELEAIDTRVMEKADRECDEHISAGRAFRQLAERTQAWGQQHRDRWVHIPGGYEICHPQQPNSPRATPEAAEGAQR
jgi:hypothetical protein